METIKVANCDYNWQEINGVKMLVPVEIKKDVTYWVNKLIETNLHTMALKINGFSSSLYSVQYSPKDSIFTVIYKTSEDNLFSIWYDNDGLKFKFTKEEVIKLLSTWCTSTLNTAKICMWDRK